MDASTGRDHIVIRKLAALALPAAMLACAPVGTDDDYVSDAPTARVVGEAVSCLNSASIRDTTVHDDRTIDFEVGGKTYRNTLTNGCGNLGFVRAFTYDTTIGQLCDNEIIYVLDNTGGDLRRGAACGLNEFVPIEYVEDDADVMTD